MNNVVETQSCPSNSYKSVIVYNTALVVLLIISLFVQ